MPDPLFNISIDSDPKFEDIEPRLRGQFVLSTIRAHKKTLIAIDDFMTYGASSNPVQPSASRYRRTFDLLNSFKSEITHRELPAIISIWHATISYAQYVIGDRQAGIHRNRWRNRDMIIRDTEIIHRENLNRGITREIRI